MNICLVQNRETSLEELSYSVIYSFDTDGSVSTSKPPHYKKLWDMTECDDIPPWIEITDKHDSFPFHRHRKYCALLTYEQFCEFMEDLGLHYECETMGSIGAPGCGMGLAPALSFSASDYDRHLNAYVTPIPGTIEGDDIVPLPGITPPIGEAEFDSIAEMMKERWSL